MMHLLNVTTLLTGIGVAFWLGWAAIGTNADHPTRTPLDVLEPRD